MSSAISLMDPDQWRQRQQNGQTDVLLQRSSFVPKLPYLCQQDSNFTGKRLAKIIDIPKKQMSDDDHIKKIPI